ncbi:hypothetical protein LTR53_008942 [Teratosphaeriaceae sp. CCFEE 6253]|nr:hypothetical protein LTR53_008942 [Teratosphaeriaceae sp. CCFEE 6253]
MSGFPMEAGPGIDYSELLELDQAALATVGSGLDLTTQFEAPQGVCPSHPGVDDCLCHGLMGDWALPALPANPHNGLDEPDYSRFENWIPRFVWPQQPCDYCRSKRLNCYLQRGVRSCTPCKTLFRCCSLEQSNTLESTNYVDKNRGTFLDTLHSVDENAAKDQGSFTGVKPLRSKDGGANLSSAPVRNDDAAGSLKRNGIRFPRHAVKTLRDWLDTHAKHPYPTEEQKVELEQRTALQPSQIANWLANARRRKKTTERPRAHMSPSLGPTTPALAIPGASEQPWEELNPFERWQHSPPEHEPASFTDIAHAVATTDLPNDSGSTSPSSAGRRKRSSNGSGFTNIRAPSLTSLDTSGAHSSKSASSALKSQGSSQSHGSFGSFNSSLAGKRDRRRRRRAAPITSRKVSDDKKRIFQCTFCTDTFASKYDWTRHEKSLHLSLEKWICHPIGPIVAEPVTNTKKCVYCGVQDPSDDHIESHNHRQCEDKGHDARTFYRKDHLRQHLRLMHGCEMICFMETWKSTAVHINSRCGFCAQRFSVWQERNDHITAHYKAGVRMSEWKGCRGLDPAVAAQVTNAMPPYLIGIEAVSPMPFSATHRASWDQVPGHTDQEGTQERGGSERTSRQVAECHMGNTDYGSKATCWEILTVRLGKYANEMARSGTVLTDEMLQTRARRILYESDDTWNQTAADNPEWLDLFKKAHGLDFIPGNVGGQGVQIPEDLETYGDLGLRIPFAVQLQAYNLDQSAEGTFDTFRTPAADDEALSARAHFRDFFAQAHQKGLLHAETFDCGHAECRHNRADISWLDGLGDGLAPRHRRWCSRELPQELLKPASIGPGTGSGTGVHTSEGAPTSTNLARGLATLVDVGNRTLHAGGRSCDSLRTNEALARYGARNCLGTGNGDDHIFAGCQVIEAQSSSRAKSLEALARLEAPLTDHAESFGEAAQQKKNYLPRHRYELPPDRARRFATTTGPWIDSGTMPEVMLPGYLDATETTTGAMTEFLGDCLSVHLPFSKDVTTSTIPLQTAAGHQAWMESLMTDDGAFLDDLDEMIAATSTAPQELSGQSLPPVWECTDPLATAACNGDAGAMPAFGGDMDLDFGDMTFDDAAFAMPVDEAFMLQDPTGY